MEITEVRVTLRDEEKLKAYASIVIDKCFIVKDLRIIDGNDRLWVAMPNKKRRDGTLHGSPKDPLYNRRV